MFRAILYIFGRRHNNRQSRAAPTGRRTRAIPAWFSGSWNWMLRIRCGNFRPRP